MRAFLIVPVDDRVDHGGADALLLRLCGAPESAARAQARARLRAAVRAARAHTRAVFVEVAPISSPALEAELDALADGAWPDGVFLQACEGRRDVQALSIKLAVREAALGVAEGATQIVALAAQTPAGVFALGSYRGASARLAGLALDGAPLPGGEAARGLVRAQLALGAAAAGVAAIDAAPPGAGAGAIAAICESARRDGFSGMLAHAADQIAAIAGCAS